MVVLVGLRGGRGRVRALEEEGPRCRCAGAGRRRARDRLRRGRGGRDVHGVDGRRGGRDARAQVGRQRREVVPCSSSLVRGDGPAEGERSRSRSALVRGALERVRAWDAHRAGKGRIERRRDLAVVVGGRGRRRCEERGGVAEAVRGEERRRVWPWRRREHGGLVVLVLVVLVHAGEQRLPERRVVQRGTGVGSGGEEGRGREGEWAWGGVAESVGGRCRCACWVLLLWLVREGESCGRRGEREGAAAVGRRRELVLDKGTQGPGQRARARSRSQLVVSCAARAGLAWLGGGEQGGTRCLRARKLSDRPRRARRTSCGRRSRRLSAADARLGASLEHSVTRPTAREHSAPASTIFCCSARGRTAAPRPDLSPSSEPAASRMRA